MRGLKRRWREAAQVSRSAVFARKVGTARSPVASLACERLERRAVLAVTWPATAPAMQVGDASQVYVNQFGDAWIDAAVLGPAGQRINGTVFWDNAGSASIRTKGSVDTEMAWYAPAGRLTNAGPGNASITREVGAGATQVVSVAGLDDVTVGLTAIEIDGPDYTTVPTISIVSGRGERAGTISGANDYEFVQFTVPTDGVWTVGANDLGCDPTLVIFDANGYPVGGSFVTAMAGDVNADWTVTWSGSLLAGETFFVRIDGAGTKTGGYKAFVENVADEFRVTSTADSGAGSLRWAIDMANLSSNPTTIVFDPAVEAGTLGLLTPLPAIRWDTALTFDSGVMTFTIDAAAVPGGSGPIINVSGWEAGGSRTFASFDTRNAALAITNFPGIGVYLPDSLYNSFVIGLTIEGRGESGSIGIAIGGGTGAQYPGTLVAGNIVSGVDYGITLASASELTLQGNFVSGCKQVGIVASGPCHQTAILANAVSFNGTGLAGYDAAGLVVGKEEFANDFSDNENSGIYLTGNARRTGIFANTFQRNNVGVTLDNAKNALVGGTPALQGNTVIAEGDTSKFQYRAGIYGVGELTGSTAINTTIETPFLGVNLAQARGLAVAQTTVRDHSGLALVAQGQGVGLAGTVVSGMKVERPGALPTVDTAGVVLIDATGMRLEAGSFEGDTTAIFIFNAAAGMVVVDNVFAGRATGVGLFQAKNLAFGQIGRGNTVKNATGAGIYTGGDLTGTTVVANNITGNAVGIVLDATTNLAIGGSTASSGNTITGTGNSTGIWARLACSGTSIKKTLFANQAANTSLGAATGITFQP